MPLIVGYILFQTASSDTWLSRTLSAPLMLRLGMCSYAAYLIHPFVVSMFKPSRIPELTPLLFGWAVVYFVVIIIIVQGAAWGIYTAIERPSMTLLRGLRGNSRDG